MKFKYRLRHWIATWGIRHVIALFCINLSLWLAVSYITQDNHLASDGDLTMGWPFPFYRTFRGEMGQGFFLSYSELAEDILIVAGMTILLTLVGSICRRQWLNEKQ